MRLGDAGLHAFAQDLPFELGKDSRHAEGKKNSAKEAAASTKTEAFKAEWSPSTAVMASANVSAIRPLSKAV